MADSENELPHENPGEFSDALSHTAATTGFNPRLIEKDYFCSLVLRELSPLFEQGLVFKGGTSLSKVHTTFHRLSEDLDFTISIETNSTRAARRAAIQPAKDHLTWMVGNLPWLAEVQSLTGANNSTQYTASFSYESQITGEAETIKVEVGLRELLLEPAERLSAGTILINPVTSERVLESLSVVSMSRHESYAEKFRAALSRLDPAIRDFFDVDHAIEDRILDIHDETLLERIRQKLAVVPDEPPDVSPGRLQSLRAQVEPQLKSVLRANDYRRFDLERAFAAVRQIHDKL